MGDREAKNEAKWRKVKTLHFRGFGEICKKFDDFLKKRAIFWNFDDFRVIYENSQKALQMSG